MRFRTPLFAFSILLFGGTAQAGDPAPGTVFRDCPDCPAMVAVPGGAFAMGSEAGAVTERPVHGVEIGRGLAVGVFEVTIGEFRRFVAETGHPVPDACWTFEGDGWDERKGRSYLSPGFKAGDDHPAVCLNWNDARAYAAWLSSVTGQPYRLLSEAEWEYVARAGTETKFSCGDDVECLEATGWSRANSGGTAHPVGAKDANPFGLHDIHGNVWEWTDDCWNDSYAGAPADGRTWREGDCSRRVLRGSAFENLAGTLRSAARHAGPSDVRFSDCGFRIARDIHGPAS